MMGELAPAPGLELIAAIEAHSLHAWPATIVDHTADGWVFRATPGLPGRGRSNHALTPARALDRGEYDGAIARATSFAATNGIACGIQVSPLDVHGPFLEELASRGWDVQQPVLVMTGETSAVAAGADPDFELTFADSATREWLAAWAHCDGRPDVDEHVRTVFPRMAGLARFAHAGMRAAGITVELDGIVGLFCIGVSPDHRRQGLGGKLVQGMLAQHRAPLTYLQVFGGNTAGVALYRSLGFCEAYRFCHCALPGSDPESPAGGAAAASGGGC